MSKIYSELSVTTDYEKLKKEPSKRKKQFYHLCDSLVSIFIIGPLVVGVWRGTWNLINYYGEYFPLWSSLSVSLSCMVLLNYFRRDFHDKFIELPKHNKSFGKTVKRLVIMRTYHYIFHFCSIMTWRCIWDIVPSIWGKKLLKNVLTNSIELKVLSVLSHY
ncbi:unnamed protein product [Diamesa tonsa]